MDRNANETRAAHEALGRYRSAVERCCQFAQSLTASAAEARDAARDVARYTQTTPPPLAWDGAPPTAAWLKSIDTLTAETKAGLAA